jgi:hypothetical protein
LKKKYKITIENNFNNMKIVFISGPLTTGWDGKDRNFILNNVQKAEAYQIALANEGIGSFCAHTHTSFHHEKGSVAPDQYYYELDMEFLKRSADALLAMPEWESSNGAKTEVEWARDNNLPIFYPTSHTDIKEVVEWAKEEI